MMQEKVIPQTIDFVKKTLARAEGGHDWWHIYRVWNLSKHIAKTEKVNVFIVELGALLHDIADHKFHNGNETLGPKITQEFLYSLKVDDTIITEVVKIIQEISFSKGMKPSTLEGMIVQDADRLDAIGAIGIARTFAYGGFKQREIYNPNIPPVHYANKEDYKNNTNPTLNHFYDKLLLLKNLMNTKKGLEMAEIRHTYMESFLEQFYQEWDGKL